MSDGDSVSGALADLGKEAVKQIVNVPKGFAAGAASQVLTQDSEEKEARKKAEKMATFYRIKEIEAEIAAIHAQNEQKKGPEVLTEKEKTELVQQQQPGKKMDEASRQAVGRAEQGRNFKG
jgi:hypothetical protein